MKKLYLGLALAAVTVCGSLVGCGEPKGKEIAVVTDVGSLMDGGFNQGTWEGSKAYAEANGKTYAYYQPANGASATNADREAAMRTAIANGAKVIVCPGFMQFDAMNVVAQEHPEVKFVFVDGWSFGLSNVTAITYKEEESGYLAGYACVKEGYTKLGGTFGGGAGNPACNRFAWGYAQGISAAAQEMNKEDIELKISFLHGESFSSSPELKTQIAGWYNSGTEVVFSCGGSMVDSVVSAADEAGKGKIVGVDVDQASLSPRVITSAVKGLSASVQQVLGQFYAGEWDAKLADKEQNLGAKENATGLPTAEGSWRFDHFQRADYDALFAAIAGGTLLIDNDVADGEAVKAKVEGLTNITATVELPSAQ